MKVAFFCIAHEVPIFRLPDYVTVIGTGNYKGDSVLDLSKSRYPLSQLYEYLDGTAGSFLISELIENNKEITHVYVFQYRKFLSREIFGVFAQNFPGMVTISSKKTFELNLDNIFRGACKEQFLFSHPILIQSTLQQYATVHHLYDLLAFSCSCIKSGIMTEQDINLFLMSKILIPGGIEFGLFPREIYCRTIEKIRIACLDFLSRFRPSNMMSSYQKRALSFCCERLTSFFLIRDIEQLFNENMFLFNLDSVTINENYKKFIGFMHTVSDEDGVYKTGK